MVNDYLSDFLARLKNATMVGKEFVEMPATKLLLAVSDVMKKEGAVLGVKKYKEGTRVMLRLDLNPMGIEESKFKTFRRLSKGGRRLYRGSRDLKRFASNGLTVISTSRGIMSVKEAIKKSLGGELLCQIK